MYYSQYKQDKFLHKYFFKDFKGGVFVDVGAYDGIKDSNTLFFEKEMEWEGICCEPMNSAFQKLMENRTSRNIMCAVDNVNDIKPFIQNLGQSEIFSCLKDADKRFQKLVDKFQQIKGGFREEIIVKTHRLETIFDQLNVPRVHYLSVDACGKELCVFESINFDKVFIDMISFDNNTPDASKDIIELLESNDFIYVCKLSGDIVMINKKSEFLPEKKDFEVVL
jgi:FkbM family methyltransferase